ncbi:reverse transcriptase, partial [Coniophora puteana RWD-64-598 SS2]
ILALAALKGWYVSGLDVRNAYLYGDLDEEIYMEVPKGFHKSNNLRKVWRLHKALYGLKQAGRQWWQALRKSLKELGFEQIQSDAGVYKFKHRTTNMVIAVIYVDDALFLG